MPEASDIDRARVVFLYTNIGRGHPGYLDGIIETLESKYPDISYFKTDVFAVSRGASLAAWKLVKRLYCLGGRGGIISALYGRLRRATASDDGNSRLYTLLGRDIMKLLCGRTVPVVVAHPILARILSKQNEIIYQHGELAAPAEAIVSGCRKVLVPLEETAGIFKRAGLAENSIEVTGQCVETALFSSVENAFGRRLERLRGDQPLTAALFSSGAYPVEHLRRLRAAAVSLVRAGHTAFIFAGNSQKVADRFLQYLHRNGITANTVSGGKRSVRIIRSVDRTAGNRQVAAVFDRFDFFIAPAHERTNWAIGLGLPFFVLLPHIGSYAPVNAEIARKRKVSFEIDSLTTAAGLAGIIKRFRQNGRLISMAEAGYQPDYLSGFDRSADIIAALSMRRAET